MILEKISALPPAAWIGFGINAVLFILCCIFAIRFWTGGKETKKRKENPSKKTYQNTREKSLNRTYGSARYSSGARDGCRSDTTSIEVSRETCTSDIGGYACSPVSGGQIFNNGMSATEDSSGNLYFANGESAIRTSNGYYYFSDGKSGYEDSSGNIHLDDGQVIMKR